MFATLENLLNVLGNYSVEENECLVSFDVVSLFTSVPVDKALALVLELLASDDSLPSRTRLSISDIKQGLQICLDSTVFFIQKVFFQANLWYSHGFLHFSYHC